jgi:hypothetical protein
MNGSDINDFAKGLVEGYARVAKIGGEVERERLLPLLASIYAEFDRAAANDASRIPTTLSLVIERARTITGPLRTAEIVRLERHSDGVGYGGDIGMSTRGMPLKAGE